MNYSLYHSFLKVSALSVAFVLLFQSGIASPVTARLASNAQSYMANAVGVQVGVVPNELNQYTAALTQKERELDEREAALVEQERSLSVGLKEGVPVTGGSSDLSTYVLSTILFILLVLIVLNYALDYARTRRNTLYVESPETAS